MDLSSKFWKTFLIVLAAFLIFTGPTYVSYVLSDVLRVDLAASMAAGFVLFVAGFILIIYMIRSKIIA